MKFFILGMFLIFNLNAQTYDYDFNMTKNIQSRDIKVDPIMNGDFSQIIRFEPISFADSADSEKSNSQLDAISDKILKYQDSGKNFFVTLIGHTEATTDDMNEVTIDSDTYANTMQNRYRKSFGAYCSADKSKKYAADIQNRLIDKGLLKSLSIVENRSGNDLLFSDGSELSNRVMVTIYVKSAEK